MTPRTPTAQTDETTAEGHLSRQRWLMTLLVVIAVAALALVTLSGCRTEPGAPLAPSSPSAESVAPGAPGAASATAAVPSGTPDPEAVHQSALRGVPRGSAAQLLAGLPVKGRAPKTGYSREQFGQAWSDDVDVEGGHNGCDTRNDILRRDLTDITFKPASRYDPADCVVASGTLIDPYSNKTIEFRRGASTSAAVQIDHLVALLNAWETGAQGLTAEQRTQLANDPLNLLAVDGSLNQAKGAGDAATWLPPAKGFRVAYVTRQIQVKAKYGLWVTPAEKDAMSRILAGS